jgi:hypothetical protein
MAMIHNHDENWLQKNWRSMMGWQYLLVCLFDFMLAPIFMGVYAYITKTPYVQWVPLTIQGGGLYHLSMGAVTGITSFAKSQEKTALIKSPYAPAPGQIVTAAPAPQADPEK